MIGRVEETGDGNKRRSCTEARCQWLKNFSSLRLPKVFVSVFHLASAPEFSATPSDSAAKRLTHPARQIAFFRTLMRNLNSRFRKAQSVRIWEKFCNNSVPKSFWKFHFRVRNLAEASNRFSDLIGFFDGTARLEKLRAFASSSEYRSTGVALEWTKQVFIAPSLNARHSLNLPESRAFLKVWRNSKDLGRT